MKHMRIDEFVEFGFLQEANRLFFHPLGLALEVTRNDLTLARPGDSFVISGIQDSREDPEGFEFADLDTDEAREKAMNVAKLRWSKTETRLKLFNAGSTIQPVPGFSGPPQAPLVERVSSLLEGLPPTITGITSE